MKKNPKEKTKLEDYEFNIKELDSIKNLFFLENMNLRRKKF